MDSEATKATYVKTVELGNAVFRNKLRDAWIPFRHPSKELGDTHGYWYTIAISWG